MNAIKYKPKKSSIKKHKVPDWFHDAKLGIFIHWSLFSVPAFAITGIDIKSIVKKEGFIGQFKNNPYAEWYLNSLRIPDSPTQKYHTETFGENFSYDDFAPIFNEEIKKWDPNEMANIFKKAGAKYVVLVTKHHDGFVLWPTQFPNPRKANYQASRDIVGELTRAVREQGLDMGFYYSGTFDWSFNPEHIENTITFITNGVLDPDYTQYANNHWHELIDMYEPKVLWNDIGYPPKTNIYEIFAHFYNKVPDGVVNDRWLQIPKSVRKFLKLRLPKAVLTWLTKRAFVKGSASMPCPVHHDYKTPEYGVFENISKRKWELTRGIGNSFGYNKLETDKDYLSSDAIIRMFVDIVSKNGNLLLNVGPMADGTIPEAQKQRLLDLGKWLEVNGEAIFGTRPWKKAEGTTVDGIELRFTCKPDALYAFLLDKPKGPQIAIKSLHLSENSKAIMLGYEGSLTLKQGEKDASIQLPENLKDSPAYAIKITPPAI